MRILHADVGSNQGKQFVILIFKDTLTPCRVPTCVYLHKAEYQILIFDVFNDIY